jgi:hypothetical protein
MIAYCDYIATLISKGLIPMDFERLIAEVDKPQYHLDDGGGFASTRKTIRVMDVYGKEYSITIEEVK